MQQNRSRSVTPYESPPVSDVSVFLRRAFKSSSRFRYESDMITVLNKTLPTLTFGRLTAADVQVFSEVPAVFGIPDLTAIRFDWDAVNARLHAGIRPLTTDAEVRVVLALDSRPVTSAELADRSGYSADYVRRTVLPLLLDSGWVVPGDKGQFIRAADAAWVSKRIVTVEAKLRDWSRALAQARRQRLSADAAYIALQLPALNSIAESLDRIAEGGIGVIGVDPDSHRARVLARPKAFPQARSLVGRMLIAERCLDMWTRDEHAGQVYPVFGWTLPSDSAE